MKPMFAIITAAVVAAALCCPPAQAQATGSVKGTATDQQGQPIAGAGVEWMSLDTGHKYELKTNSKGEYFSLGIAPGKYKVTLSKDGKEIFHYNNVPVTLDEQHLDIDLKKEMGSAAAAQGMNAEQVKAQQEAQAKVSKENLTVKALNEHLAAANDASTKGDYDGAISILTEATNMDATRDLLWFKLGDAYRMSATKQTDPAEKQKRLETAIANYNKAIEIKNAEQPGQGASKDPEARANTLSAYYNNLAEAYAKSGKFDDAIKNYDLAAKAQPSAAGTYYFNAGAQLTNAGRVDEAIAQFDKCIAADPTKADAYYQKGVNMLGKMTVDKDGKTTAAPGTAEAFQKYLELDPNGKYAASAKDLLASIGSTVETSFGKKKAPPKK
jgi:tetratricopeptide (TPR) repeat protein